MTAASARDRRPMAPAPCCQAPQKEMLHLVACAEPAVGDRGRRRTCRGRTSPLPAHHFPAAIQPHADAVRRASAPLHFIFLERPEGLPRSAVHRVWMIVVGQHDDFHRWPAMTSFLSCQDFATISHLYRSIEDGIAHLAEKFGEAPPLRVVHRVRRRRHGTSNSPSWWPSRMSRPPGGRSTSSSSRGRASRGAWGTSHFGRLVAILEEYRAMRAEQPDFSPARPVMFATVRRSEYDTSVPLIEDHLTARCTDLFNVAYELLGQVMERYFAHTDETDDQLWTRARADPNPQ